MRRALLLVVLSACCPVPGPATGPGAVPPPPPEVLADAAADARAVIESFVAAVEAEDFEGAFVLLEGALRARYTPARLASDHAEAQGVARARLDRVRAGLAGGAATIVEGDRAYLALGGGLAVRLVREVEGWRICALE